MAFGKSEYYSDDYISYKESINMLLSDLKSMGYGELTKEKLNEILQNNFSVGKSVRLELIKILDRL